MNIITSSSILGLFEFHFVCLRLFHKIFWTILNKVRQAFCLPFDRIAQDQMDELAWFFFFMLPC